jgi:hypothetical protein
MSLNGAFLQSGVGLVQTAGTITTANQNIEFDSAVTLTGNVFLNTGGAPGDVTFLSPVDGAHGLNINARNVRFDANVGGTPLTSLQVTASGTITITGDQTVSTGPMVYNGEVVLLTNSRFTDNGSSGMVFNVITGDAISGNVNVDLIATATTITIEGDIDLSGGTGLSGGNLSISSGGTTTSTGQILTKGGDDLAGTGGNGGSVSITSSGGSVSVHNINTSGGAGTVSGSNGGDITLEPASGYTGGYPIGLIVLNSDLSLTADGNLVSIAGSGGGGSGGTITLSAHRSSPATVATITSSLSGNDITITGANIVMGLDEAMTGLGNITLTATNLTLGDLVALRDLTCASGCSST